MNENMARAWVERALQEHWFSTKEHVEYDLRESVICACAAAVAAVVKASRLEAAQHFQDDAASCRGYGGNPCGADPRMHGDAHDYCHARFEAAEWLRDHATAIPPVPEMPS